MRQPIVAGQFYESDFTKLNKQIQDAFESGPGSLPLEKRNKNILAAIIPHAGYPFSAKCASWAFKEIAESKFPEVFILLGVNHSGTSDKALISLQDWNTPFGLIKVDKDAASRLISNFIEVDETSHQNEHSIEVQLPFLQFISKNNLDRLKILPIILSSLNISLIKKLAEKIFSLKKPMIIIASSDFIHYGVSYGYMPFKFNIKQEVANLEKQFYTLICNLETEKFISLAEKTRATICGAAPIAVLLELVKKFKIDHGRLLCNYNSGNITHDYSNFVGYASFIFGK